MGSKSTQARALTALRARIGLRVRNIDRRSLQNAAYRKYCSFRSYRMLVSEKLLGIGQSPACGPEMQQLPVKPGHQDGPCIQQAHCALGDSLEHRLNVRRRTGDDLQYLGSRRLLRTRFFQVFVWSSDRATLSSGGRWRTASLSLAGLVVIR